MKSGFLERIIEMAKKRRYKKRKKTANKLDVAIVALIAVSVLLAVLIYSKSGIVGLKLNEVLRWNVRYYAICITSWNFCNCN